MRDVRGGRGWERPIRGTLNTPLEPNSSYFIEVIKWGNNLKFRINGVYIGTIANGYISAQTGAWHGVGQGALDFVYVDDFEIRTPRPDFNIDYTETDTPLIGTLTFEAGETEKTVDVEIFGDSYDESDENVIIKLSNPSDGDEITVDQTQLIIQDDDTTEYTISNPTVSELADEITFIISRSGNISEAETLYFRTVSVEAQAFDDYNDEIVDPRINFEAKKLQNRSPSLSLTTSMLRMTRLSL